MPHKHLAAPLLLALSAVAGALPALPADRVISGAVQTALSQPGPVQLGPVQPSPGQPGPAQVGAAPAAAAPQSAQQAAAQAYIQETLAVTQRAGRSAVARATAYNSLAGQTDSTPHITATGTRTRPGVVALSRDLLRTFPYGTRVTLQDLSGRYNFGSRVFIVEDTMAARKTSSIDIWMGSYSEAIRFGARQVRITAVR
ncbi:3D domain-containing protein [Deinococcus petrolearius]|uniref:3D domain-containing protein n=1 Tax=Deinococcus petrolearius TaxID=1751295 RepID=A0ABW1DFN8_9DEIO